MNAFLSKTVHLFKLLRNYFPKRLPTGAQEFGAYWSDLSQTYSLPTGDSYRQTLATMIMHTKQTAFYIAPAHYAKCIRKAMANQVAYEVIDQIRQDEKKAQEALSSNITPIKGEATPSQGVCDAPTPA